MNQTITDLLLSATDTIVQYFRTHPKLRLISLFLFPILAVFGLLVRHVVTLTDGTRQTDLQQLAGNICLFVIAAMVYLFLCSVLALTRFRFADSSTNVELERLRQEREELKKRVEVEHSERGDVFDSIRLSLNQLTEYYTINKGQARSSFRSSIFALVVGLATLVSGVWFFYFHRGNIQLASLSAISGLLVQFIGGAYFVLYKKSLEQLNFFYDSLLTTQDTMLAIQLAEKLDEKLRDDVYDKIIMALISRKRGQFSSTATRLSPRNTPSRKEPRGSPVTAKQGS
jgi:hypothetical protein